MRTYQKQMMITIIMIITPLSSDQSATDNAQVNYKQIYKQAKNSKLSAS